MLWNAVDISMLHLGIGKSLKGRNASRLLVRQRAKLKYASTKTTAAQTLNVAYEDSRSGIRNQTSHIWTPKNRPSRCRCRWQASQPDLSRRDSRRAGLYF